MQEINELSRTTKDELRQIAQGLEISKTSAMKKSRFPRKLTPPIRKRPVLSAKAWGYLTLYQKI